MQGGRPIQNVRILVDGWRSGDGPKLSTFLALVFCAGVFSAPVGSLLPVYVDSTLHQGPGFTATLKVLQLAMVGLFALIGGTLADRIGQKKALLIGFGGLPLGLVVFAIRDFWILAVAILILGMTTSLQTVGGQSYLVASANQKRLGALTALYYLGNTLGGALGNAVLATAADRFGFPTVGLVGAVASLGLIVLAVARLPDVGSSFGRSGREAPASMSDYVILLRDRQIALIGALRFFTTCFYGATSLLMPLLVYRLSGSIATAGVYSTVSLIVATATQLAVGRLVDQYGVSLPVRILTTGVLFAAIAASFSTHSLGPFFVTGVFATSILWGLSTSMTTLARLASGPNQTGRVLGFLHLCWSAGMLIGTGASGVLVSV
ncbi:MAG TPA: MFS transporter, partial [Chloroflexota bacterium]|nr:MFS transporter [Chloroflexota bacterium]